MTGGLMSLLGTARTGVSGAFESIATATGTGSSNTITFSSIPQNFASLQIRAILKATGTSSSATDASLTFNGDTNAVYAFHTLVGDGSAAYAGGEINTISIRRGGGVMPTSNTTYFTNIVGVAIVDIHNYASSTQNKTVRIFTGVDHELSANKIYLMSGLWRNTAAITSLSLYSESGNFATSTQFSLYGIKGA